MQALRCKQCSVSYVGGSKLPSPVLEQTSHPPTRNLVGKAHEAASAATQRSSLEHLNEPTGMGVLVARSRSILETRDGGYDAHDGVDKQR